MRETMVFIPHMDWYFDEVPKKRHGKKHAAKEEIKERKELAPHMEYYMDEIAEEEHIRCPVTGLKADIEVIRRAGIDDTPFVDVTYCSIFGCAPTCEKKCLGMMNFKIVFHKS